MTPRPPMPLTLHSPGSGHSTRIGERQRLAVDDRDVERERVEALHATEVDAVRVLAVLSANTIEPEHPLRAQKADGLSARGRIGKHDHEIDCGDSSDASLNRP